MIVAGIVAVLALALGLALILLYNALVRGRNLAEEAWSGINVQLRRRHDLVPALLAAVQGYAAHEKDVLAAVAGAREAGMKAAGHGTQAVGAAEKGLAFITLEVRASNAAAIALYEDAGFRPVGTRRNFYTAPQEDAVLMTWTAKE